MTQLDYTYNHNHPDYTEEIAMIVKWDNSSGSFDDILFAHDCTLGKKFSSIYDSTLSRSQLDEIGDDAFEILCEEGDLV